MSDSFEVKQNTDFSIECECQTVDWLVENTMANKFRIEDGIVMGYQREIKDSYVSNIIKYIEGNPFYFPSNIVCSVPKDKRLLEKSNKQYFVVDGQHRIEAFRIIKKENPDLYNKIKEYTIPITKLVNVSEPTEISTFITINKTSRKVDTSLAYALKKRIEDFGEDSGISKVDYAAIMLAENINDDKNNFWNNKISFDNTKNKSKQDEEEPKLLSLNAFVKAVRRLIRALEKIHLIELDANDDNSFQPIIDEIKHILNCIWGNVEKKWGDLFEKDKIQNNVLLGPIGFTSICKYIAYQITKESISDNIENDINQFIMNIGYGSEEWLKYEDPAKKKFCKYTSESGYSVIAALLVGSYKRGISKEEN